MELFEVASGQAGRSSRHPKARFVALAAHEHPIRKASLPLEVNWILERLRWNGYLAYIVGGAVRDLLMHHRPKDFDLGTDASPEEVSRLFVNSRIVGRRFRIVHVYFRDGNAIEVSTFRGLPAEGEGVSGGGALRDDNLYGSPAEDAWRRDLTINGLFYDSDTGEVRDYVGGLADLQSRRVRTIGPPAERFREDPVRMVRTIRHAGRHLFDIEPGTWEALGRCAPKIKGCSASRSLLEFSREMRGGNARRSFRLMLRSGLLAGWIPQLARWLEQETPPTSTPNRRFGPYVRAEWGTPTCFWQQLQTVDAHLGNGRSLPDCVLFASLLLPVGWAYVHQHCKRGTTTRRLWRDALEGPLLEICKEIPLRHGDIEDITRLIHTYWRLHLFPHQQSLADTLRQSPFLADAIQLLELDLQTHQVHFPSWLEELKASL